MRWLIGSRNWSDPAIGHRLPALDSAPHLTNPVAAMNCSAVQLAVQAPACRSAATRPQHLAARPQRQKHLARSPRLRVSAAAEASPVVGAPQQQHVIKVSSTAALRREPSSAMHGAALPSCSWSSSGRGASCRAPCRSAGLFLCMRWCSTAPRCQCGLLRLPPLAADGQPGDHLLRHAADRGRHERDERRAGQEH